VLDLLRTNGISRERFERPPQRQEAIYLDAAGRALLVDRYEALLKTSARLPSGEQTALRRVLLLQAQQAARVVRGEQARYVGFLG
jgi:CRISPR-associated protein Cas1